MSLILLSKIRLPNPPLNISTTNSKLYISTKSNKIIETDMNLKNKKIYKISYNITNIIPDNDTLICILKNKSIIKFNILNKKEHKINIKMDISYIKKYDNKYLIGTTDGKLMYTDYDFKPLRMFYGNTNKILDVCPVIKNKMISVDNKLVIIDTKSSKIKSNNLGFVTCLDILSNKNILVGTDTSVNIFDYEKDKLIKEIKINYPVSCIRNINDKIFIGCESGKLYICKHTNNDLIFLNEKDLEGSINFIEEINNKIYIGTGREEKNGSYSRKKTKNNIYKFTI